MNSKENRTLEGNSRTERDWRQYACSFCDCSIWARSLKEAESERGWSWDTGEATCEMCGEADVGADKHDCWQMAHPDSVRCSDNCVGRMRSTDVRFNGKDVWECDVCRRATVGRPE